MALRKIRIVGDGLSRNVRLVDADTGEDLRLPVTAVTWRASADRAAVLCTADVTLQAVSIDAVALVERLTTEIFDCKNGTITTETRRL